MKKIVAWFFGKKGVFLFLILAWSGIGFLQAKSISFEKDSIKRLIGDEKNDLKKIDVLLALGYIMSDSSVFFLEKARKMAIKYDKSELQALATYKIGIYKIRTGDILDGTAVLQELLAEAEKYNSSFMRALAIHGISKAYLFINDYDQALSFQRKSKSLLQSAEGLNKHELWLEINLDLGETYLYSDQVDSASLILEPVFESISNNRWKKTYSIFMSELYIRQGKTDKGLTMAYENFSWANDNANQYGFAWACNSFARSFSYLGKPDSVIKYSILAVEAAKGSQNTLVNTQSLRRLTELYDSIDEKQAYKYLKELIQLSEDLYGYDKVNELQKTVFKEQQKLRDAENLQKERENRTRMGVLIIGLLVLILVAIVLLRSNLLRKKTNQILQKALENLKAAQSQLIQSEKMASLGELTAGIAHEIQNPLNFVNNFAEVNSELIAEMKGELHNGNIEEARKVADNIDENEKKISYHGRRADGIVKSMLQHSRHNSGKKELTDLNALADEYLRLAYHGLRAKDKSFNAKFDAQLDPTLEKISVVPQEIGRVMLNLINNSFYSVSEKRATADDAYEPTVTVSTKMLDCKVEIRIEDNGDGMPEELKEKIFQPFFTTKPTGQGTGLGLSMSYDIITKVHGGQLSVESEPGEGATFIIVLPIE
jgi:signal transduction histidine kinase